MYDLKTILLFYEPKHVNFKRRLNFAFVFFALRALKTPNDGAEMIQNKNTVRFTEDLTCTVMLLVSFPSGLQINFMNIATVFQPD